MSRFPDLLPKVLQGLDSFAAMPAAERTKFSHRSQYILGILNRVEDFFSNDANGDDIEKVRDLFDNLELDLMNCLSIKSTEKISPWLVHSSWTFETSAKKMAATLTQDQLEQLQEPSPTSACSVTEFLEWVSRIAPLVGDLRQSFLEADTLDAAVGRLIALDVALTAFLLGISRQRLNPELSR